MLQPCFAIIKLALLPIVQGHGLRRAGEIIPEVFDQLKFLGGTQLKYGCLVHRGFLDTSRERIAKS